MDSFFWWVGVLALSAIAIVLVQVALVESYHQGYSAAERDYTGR